jgi:hypothetical protein
VAGLAEDGEGEKIYSIGGRYGEKRCRVLPMAFPIGIPGKIQVAYIYALLKSLARLKRFDLLLP